MQVDRQRACSNTGVGERRTGEYCAGIYFEVGDSQGKPWVIPDDPETAKGG